MPSFGLLHRIPPIPEDREPGAIPVELTEQPEYEEQHLFVPADLTEGIETPEQMAERLRWEQEELEREAYARNYATAVNSNSSSAYILPSASEPNAPPYTSDSALQHGDLNISEVRPSRSTIQAPTVMRDTGKPTQLAMAEGPLPSPPVRTAPSPLPRSLTPTPNRPFGFHVNGELLPFSIGQSLSTLRSGYSSSHAILGCAHVRRWS